MVHYYMLVILLSSRHIVLVLAVRIFELDEIIHTHLNAFQFFDIILLYCVYGYTYNINPLNNLLCRDFI